MEDRILYQSCPLCESKMTSMHRAADCSKHLHYDKRLEPVIRWKKCTDCGHVFTEGYYSKEACEIIFGKTHENQKVGSNLEPNRLISSRMIEKVLPFVSGGNWLDVGFGNGSLLFTAGEYGFTPIGADLRVDNVRILNQLGIEAHHKNIVDLELKEKCSVVSMADVLEHIPYPKAALAAANELLKSGGVILISMPNSENILWQAMNDQNANPYWGEIEHYHNFGRTRLYSLLTEFGFAPRRYGVSERYRVCMEVVAQKLT